MHREQEEEGEANAQKGRECARANKFVRGGTTRRDGASHVHAAAVTTQEASDGSREKTMRVANIENNSLNWVSISSEGTLDMTNCDFSERRARDEMRHIIGSSEPDVISGGPKQGM